MAVEWDPGKAASNARKHGVRFADAISALEDERAITVPDDTGEEQRWVTIGMDGLARVLTVVYTWRSDNIRVISARPATPREQRQYLENS
ncbi:MAG: BrnT family toxin [Acidobacteria bacterium]|nr:BrnT family toxin [Acidobacteriota bacterium]